MSIAYAAPAVTRLEVWRLAHRAAVKHLIAASYSECGCTAVSLCATGQAFEDRAEDAERVLGFATAAPGCQHCGQPHGVSVPCSYTEVPT